MMRVRTRENFARKSEKMVARRDKILYYLRAFTGLIFSLPGVHCMQQKLYAVIGVSAALAIATACGHQGSSPVSPSGVRPIVAVDEVAGANGATLKVSSPTLVSPINDTVLADAQPTLVCQPVAPTTGAAPIPVAYDWEVYDSSGTKVRTEVVTTTSWKAQGLNYEQRYTWRVRATASYIAADGKTVDTFGPWSNVGSFITPQNKGYIRGNELYDPLFNGETVGNIVGPAHFVPGVGISLDSLGSYVSYQLQTPLIEGEFSMLAQNVRTRHEGGKTKLMAMSDGYDDITTNDRRATYEKRSDGTMAWRIITHDDQIETGSAERVFVQYNLTDTFAFGMDWHANIFSFYARRGGYKGKQIYGQSKHWSGAPYDPKTHVLYLGGPGGRAGEDSGSVPNIIIRQVWASASPRPDSINQ
jgi:hypothetical protein